LPHTVKIIVILRIRSSMRFLMADEILLAILQGKWIFRVLSRKSLVKT